MMRLRYVKQGGHYHCRLFSGKHELALGKCGDLVFNEREWPEVQERLYRGGIEVLPEVERGEAGI